MGLAEIALQASQRNQANQQAVDIITFIEAPWGLGVSLFPVQRIIIKAHYGLELDDSTANVTISDWRREKFETLTEAGYLRKLHAEGRSNIKEVIPGEERRELVLSIGRRSGKCIIGDSLVLTDGGIRRIENMGDPDGPEVQSLKVGVAQEGSTQSRSAFFYNGGVKATRTLTTHCGYRLGGTDNHRIKVLTDQGVVDWKYLADLQVGDVVCIHRNTNLWAPDYVDCTPFHNDRGYKDLVFPDRLTEAWGRMLGYLVGDGLGNYKGRVEITVDHPETLKRVYMELLGCYSVVMDKRTENTENTGAIKFDSVGMMAFLHDLGFRLGTDRDAKMVPWSILQSPRSVVQAFLRGLFEADGMVEKDGHVVSFSTTSGRLAREVQTLLLNLGIVSRIKPKAVNGTVYWVLTIRGLRHRRVFAELVGFDSHKKMEPLLRSLDDTGREGGDAESIPHQRQWCRRLFESVPKAKPRPGQKQAWGRSDLRDLLGNTIKPSASDQMTYPRLADAVPVARQLGADSEILAHFEHLIEVDYFFDPVVQVDEGFNSVFDLNVPNGESFVANGMTNHNTFICACVVAYEVYKLIIKHSPQGYYGLPKTNMIGLISVATDKDQAALLYNEASGHFGQCGFFKTYTANNTMSYAKFQTPADIDKYGRYADDPTAKATINVTFKSCVAKGLRGPGNIVIILDELAHFNDVGQSDAAKIYKAVKPSLAAFSPKDVNDSRIPVGPVEGRILSISSPLGKDGHFYDLYRMGFGGGLAAATKLCIQAPTWEVNPTVEVSFLAGEYASDPIAFFTEYGADFASGARNWIPRHQDLLACVDPQHRPAIKAAARSPHFMGVDISAGLPNGDYCAVAIGHVLPDGRIVLDHIERIRSGEAPYLDQERLGLDDIADWLYKLSRRFYITSGIFDQWAGIPFEDAVHKLGLTQLESVFFTKPDTSRMFQNFKDMMYDNRLVLYDWPLPLGDANGHCEYITELLELRAKLHSKYVITVEAPSGGFDDYSDAIIRMVWQASKCLGKNKHIAGNARQGRQGNQMSPTQVAKAVRKAKIRSRFGGSSGDRQHHPLMRGKSRGRR